MIAAVAAGLALLLAPLAGQGQPAQVICRSAEGDHALLARADRVIQ
jgi:hypothetical protein